jgi:hypothetical protein
MRAWYLVCGCGLVLMLSVLLGGMVSAGEPPLVEAGLLTRLVGDVTWKADGTAKESPAKAFMKVRVGDVLRVPEAGIARVIFFENGRQETWSGPCHLRIGRSSAKSVGDLSDSKPVVGEVPRKVAQGATRIPDLLAGGSGSRLGGALLRGTSAKPTAPLTEEQEAEIEQAREVCDEMRKAAPADDLTPELYLLGVLAEHARYREMQEVIDAARKRFPDSPELKKLAEWVTRMLKWHVVPR